MAENTKRARSHSNDPEATDNPAAKRPNLERAEQGDVKKEGEGKQTKEDQKSNMAEQNGSTDIDRQEERDAVELGLGDAGDDLGAPQGADDGTAGTSAAAGEGVEASGSNAAAEGAEGSPSADPNALQPQHIAMRALIVTGDASIIIGKQGRHINEIRDKSGARLTISESIPGNPERVMTVAGQLDAVSKVS